MKYLVVFSNATGEWIQCGTGDRPYTFEAPNDEVALNAVIAHTRRSNGEKIYDIDLFCRIVKGVEVVDFSVTSDKAESVQQSKIEFQALHWDSIISQLQPKSDL